MVRCGTELLDAEPHESRETGVQSLLGMAVNSEDRRDHPDGPPQLTMRACLGGLAIGTVLCFTNMYFGLQTGWVTMGSIQCAVVGFAMFRFCPASAHVLSAHENVVLQTVGVATATMPLSAGFVGIIPALKMLHPPNGPADIAVDPGVQVLWALSLTYFGIFFAVPLRRQVILVEQLRFPSGTATAKLIEVLHTRDGVRATQNAIRTSARLSTNMDSSLANESPPHIDAPPMRSNSAESLQHTRWRSLIIAFCASFFTSLIAFLVPATANVRIFDLFCLPNVSNWHWTLRPSLSYVGQGMIMGLRPAGSAFIGALLAWGLLGPVALANGWTAYNATVPLPQSSSCSATVTSAQIDSWEDGAQGWLLWVALALMLGEALTSLMLILFRQGYPVLRSFLGVRSPADGRVEADSSKLEVAPDSELVPVNWWAPGLLGSAVLTVAVVSPLFGMAIWESTVAVLLSCLVSVLAVRALGQTDLNPVSGVGKLSQIIFAGLSPGAIVPNVVAGAVAEAGAMQVGDLMQDLKTGHLLRASPRAQFLAQLIGASASVFVTVGAYQLYSHVYEIPSEHFQAPVAHIWKDMAILMQKGIGALPSTARDFAGGFGCIGIVLPLLEELGPPTLVAWLPSGVSIGIGMYVTADWTIPRLVGAMGEMMWRRTDPDGHREHMLMVASGFVLGEGVMSICALALTAAHIPKVQ